MAYGRSGFAQAPWSGTDLPAPDIGDLPPPIPGDAATFAYSAQLGAYPWAYGAWAGGFPLSAYPGGGVLAHPDDDTGIVTVSAWWPDATTLQVVRITPDGVRTPVRGGYPLIVTTATRRNAVTNPSIEVGTNGFVPDAGTPTLSQLADASAPAGSSVLRAQVAGSGSNGVTVPTSLTVVPPAGGTVTVGFSLRTNTLASSVTVSIGWTDIGGGALSASSATLTADQRSASLGQFTRHVVTVSPPTGAVTPTLKITCGGMLAGGQMDLDAITFEVGTTDGSFFDGGTLGGLWLGTTGLSGSLLSPVQTILDAECPLDTIVRYQVSYPGITGGRVVSDPVTLNSDGQTWLSHPLLIGQPVKVELARVPVLERAVEQGIFLPIGASRPKVVSSARRQAPTGTLDFVTLSFAERDALLALMDQPMPLLLRLPVDFGYPAPMWLAIGLVTEDRGDFKAWQENVTISAEVTEVDVPPVL
ncbi:MAG TPA: hypothetical protein VFX53_17140 [Pedococcus sp.]|nr:hypothetical protein [Pedococcus sp.]